MNMHQSFISFKNGRYGIWAAFVSMAAIVAYAMDTPRQPPNGGTILGYTLGITGALLIVFLMWLGVRKRSYSSTMGSVAGWLSGHVYFGLALLLIATLHTGFQFGYNIHTYNYILMCLVIASGIWGAYTYLRYPSLLNRKRGHVSREALYQEIAELDRQAMAVAKNLDIETHDVVADAIRRTFLGGGRLGQLLAQDRSRLLLMPDADVGGPPRIVDNSDQKALIELLADKQTAGLEGDSASHLHDLLEIVGNKASVLRKLRKDIQLQGLMQYWLYFHLPLSFGLLAALVAHIISVFLYW